MSSESDVVLRHFKLSDLTNLYSLFCDPLILRNLDIGKTAQEFTIDDERAWLERTINQYKSANPVEYHLAIDFRTELAGSIGAFNQKSTTMEVGIWAGRKYWGNRIVRPAISLFKEELSKKFKIERATAYILENNHTAIRIAEDVGFKIIDSDKDGWRHYEVYS